MANTLLPANERAVGLPVPVRQGTVCLANRHLDCSASGRYRLSFCDALPRPSLVLWRAQPSRVTSPRDASAACG